jgi:quinolinate synthase
MMSTLFSRAETCSRTKEAAMATALSDVIDPRLDLFAEIEALKRKRNAVVLAHFYQEPDIQDIADVVADSLGLAQAAARTDADVIVLAGVHFMAETAKILNPTQRVLLPSLEAGCSLAGSCPPERFAAFRAMHPDHWAVTYINSSAAVKAVSDVICTSSNAERIIRRVPEDWPILFAPDQNLGRYLAGRTGRRMLLWPGLCIVHAVFSERKIRALLGKHPEAELIAHPECDDAILELASYVGSTAALLDYAVKSPRRIFIVATESGILHQMEKQAPKKTFIPAPPDNQCACNECPHMRHNTLEKVYVALRDLEPEIAIEEDLRLRALRPIERMLAWSSAP